MRILSELFPDVMNLHYEASGYKPHMGWTVAADVVHHSDFPFRNGALTLWRGGGGGWASNDSQLRHLQGLAVSRRELLHPRFHSLQGQTTPKTRSVWGDKDLSPLPQLGTNIKSCPNSRTSHKIDCDFSSKCTGVQLPPPKSPSPTSLQKISPTALSN